MATRASTVLERLARLETVTTSLADDAKEIKTDVKLLLETKWKAEGKRMGVAAIVALFVSLIAPLIGK